MKKLLVLLFVCFCAVGGAYSQRMVIGEKSPEIKVAQWLLAEPATDSKAIILEFYHSSNNICKQRLSQLNIIAKKFKNDATVIVIGKETKDKIGADLTKDNPAYYPALDDAGKTFAAFGVQVVPYAVIIDKKGRIAWVGNSTTLNEDTISKTIK